MSRKANSMAVYGYTPGPDLDNSPAPGNQQQAPLGTFGTEVDPAQVAYTRTETYLSRRIRNGLGGAAAVQQFTPDQAYFRGSLAAGRWQSDGPAHAAITRITQDPATGCMDTVRMEPTSRVDGPDGYIDLGGKGGVDYAARRP